MTLTEQYRKILSNFPNKAEVIRKSGVSKSAYYDFVRGKTSITIKNLDKIMAAANG